jgi:hypothetical protein
MTERSSVCQEGFGLVGCEHFVTENLNMKTQQELMKPKNGGSWFVTLA